jgi:hypothetical protein
MNTFNAITSAIFDVVLSPWGHALAWIDLVLWSVLCGVVALVVYKYISNQKAIETVKDRIKVHLLEIRLFRHDPLVVLGATGKVFLTNFIYIGHNLIPMMVLMVPMLAVLIQLEANYAFAPAEVGSVQLFQVALDESSELRPTDITLSTPEGVEVDAGPVRTADGEVFWRLRAKAEGDHALRVEGGGASLSKMWSVGGEHRKVSIMRTSTWEGWLYPGEPGIPDGSPFKHMEIRNPEREFGLYMTGELGVLIVFFGLSLVAGYALKDVFGVTL